jgi:hypothetical protein
MFLLFPAVPNPLPWQALTEFLTGDKDVGDLPQTNARQRTQRRAFECCGRSEQSATQILREPKEELGAAQGVVSR